jgi:hypothetical protein
LNSWDICYDSAVTNQSYIRQFGINDLGGQDNPKLHTSGQRAMLWRMRFSISPNARPQSILIDTTWDSRNMSLALGLMDGVHVITPAFVQGGVHIQSTGIDDSPSPAEFTLKPNYPNPFNSSTAIGFGIDKEDYVSLVVYDLLGRQVRYLLQNNLPAGEYNVIWDGRDNRGFDVVSGVYYYRLSVSDRSITNKMLLLR